MSDGMLDSLDLPRVAIAADAPLSDAARALTDVALGAIAVIDGERVVGMLTEDDLLRALFPRYVDELTHTAFVDADTLLRPHFDEAATRRVREVMREPEIVELPASALDLAQRFLHSDSSALIATRAGAFAGVVDQTQFCKALIERYEWQA